MEYSGSDVEITLNVIAGNFGAVTRIVGDVQLLPILVLYVSKYMTVGDARVEGV
jgi:hypothetical protein